MADFIGLVPALLLAILVGYVLGALPLADRISRRHGVDIFSVGTGLAGASNVRRMVGRVPGSMVLLGDFAKGAATVILSESIGVEGPWLLLPVAAAVAGHWRSAFTGFKGGDGLATVGGSAMALFSIYGVISVATGLLVAMGLQRMRYSSLLSVVFGYATLVWLSVNYEQDTILAVGFGGVAALVLAYALNGHRRRRHADDWDEVEEADGAEQTEGSRS